MTYKMPRLLTILHFEQRFRMDAVTFIISPSSFSQIFYYTVSLFFRPEPFV
jgi:hypothetical protein